MSNYIGDFIANSTINFTLTTNAATGAAVAPSSAFEAADLIIYKGSSATQRTSAAGVTMTSPFDTITGLHMVSIDTSDNTDAGFWVAGADYHIILSPDETVDSVTVVAEVAHFSIQNRLNLTTLALPDGPIPALGIFEGGTAQSASATGIVGRAAAAVADNAMRGSTLMAFGSTQGYWQSAIITENALTGDTFTIDAWPAGVTPSGTITYRIVGTPGNSTTLLAPVNATQLGGDTQSLTDLKDFADSGYDPATNKVQGVVLADAVTVVNGLAANVLTAASTAADYVTELQAGLATATSTAAILAMLDDPRGEPGQGTPAVNADMATKVDWLYKAWRNLSTQTATEYNLYNDAGNVVDQKSAASDDGTTFTRAEIVTGP
jgi:hypothetical protein